MSDAASRVGAAKLGEIGDGGVCGRTGCCRGGDSDSGPLHVCPTQPHVHNPPPGIPQCAVTGCGGGADLGLGTESPDVLLFPLQLNANGEVPGDVDRRADPTRQRATSSFTAPLAVTMLARQGHSCTVDDPYY